MVTGMSKQLKYGFYQGNVNKLKEDLAALKPTLFCSVPRLYTRFYEAMHAKINELTGVKKTITDWAIQKKLSNLSGYGQLTHAVYDRLVFNKFKEVLGGNVRFMLTGSAPI